MKYTNIPCCYDRDYGCPNIISLMDEDENTEDTEACWSDDGETCGSVSRSAQVCCQCALECLINREGLNRLEELMMTENKGLDGHGNDFGYLIRWNKEHQTPMYIKHWKLLNNMIGIVNVSINMESSL